MPEPETFQPQVEPAPISQTEQAPSTEEAPAAVKLRSEARECFGEINKDLEAARQKGDLSDDEISDFAFRFATEVKGRLDLAESINIQRRAFLAEQSAPMSTFIERGVVTGVEEAHRQGLHPELEAPHMAEVHQMYPPPAQAA